MCNKEESSIGDYGNNRDYTRNQMVKNTSN